MIGIMLTLVLGIVLVGGSLLWWLRSVVMADTVAIPMILAEGAAEQWFDHERWFCECNLYVNEIPHRPPVDTFHPSFKVNGPREVQ